MVCGRVLPIANLNCILGDELDVDSLAVLLAAALLLLLAPGPRIWNMERVDELTLAMRTTKYFLQRRQISIATQWRSDHPDVGLAGSLIGSSWLLCSFAPRLRIAQPQTPHLYARLKSLSVGEWRAKELAEYHKCSGPTDYRGGPTGDKRDCAPTQFHVASIKRVSPLLCRNILIDRLSIAVYVVLGAQGIFCSRLLLHTPSNSHTDYSVK